LLAVGEWVEHPLLGGPHQHPAELDDLTLRDTPGADESREHPVPSPFEEATQQVTTGWGASALPVG
jgi:hypothetical protein